MRRWWQGRGAEPAAGASEKQTLQSCMSYRWLEGGLAFVSRFSGLGKGKGLNE